LLYSGGVVDPPLDILPGKVDGIEGNAGRYSSAAGHYVRGYVNDCSGIVAWILPGAERLALVAYFSNPVFGKPKVLLGAFGQEGMSMGESLITEAKSRGDVSITEHLTFNGAVHTLTVRGPFEIANCTSISLT
jgi:hypothetical protein